MLKTMRKSFSKFIFPIIFLVILLQQGCAATFGATIGYHSANSKYSKQYIDYKADCLSSNEAREKKGLPSESVKEYKEWLKDQPLTMNEVKCFHLAGVFSNEEARELKNRIKISRKNHVK